MERKIEGAVRVVRLLLAITRCARAEQVLARAACTLHWIILVVVPALAQHERGEIRLKVRDPKGGALVAASVDLVSQANQVRRSFLTGQDGSYAARELPFGTYHLRVSCEGFLSAVGCDLHMHSMLPPVSTSTAKNEEL